MPYLVSNTYLTLDSSTSMCDDACSKLMSESMDDEIKRQFLDDLRTHGDAICNGELNDADTEHALCSFLGLESCTTTEYTGNDCNEHKCNNYNSRIFNILPRPDESRFRNNKDNMLPDNAFHFNLVYDASLYAHAANRKLAMVSESFNDNQRDMIKRHIEQQTDFVHSQRMTVTDAIELLDKILSCFVVDTQMN